MENTLKPELVMHLDLEQIGVDDPAYIILALEGTQGEICENSGFAPHEVFRVQNNLLQCLKLQNGHAINEQQGVQVINALLNYVAQNRIPDRIITFNGQTGVKLVESSTFEECSISIAGLSVPCFTTAALYLGNHLVRTVLFARII